MPVFTLKKYDAPTEKTVSEDHEAKEAVDKENDELNRAVSIHASDTVSKIVADALYKTLSRVEESNDKKETEPADAQVISTEDINLAPADVWNSVKKSNTIVIVNEGFRTAKEEWFLSTLEEQGKKVFYSVESYLTSLQLKA